MKLIDYIYSISLLAQSRRRLINVNQQLQSKSYQDILNQAIKVKPTNASVYACTKSYFWACRLLKDCQCLPRSIALYQYLKAVGFQEIEHKFGVNKTNVKLNAHAWVEFKNQPLNESDDLLQKFNVLEKE